MWLSDTVNGPRGVGSALGAVGGGSVSPLRAQFPSLGDSFLPW